MQSSRHKEYKPNHPHIMSTVVYNYKIMQYMPK